MKLSTRRFLLLCILGALSLSILLLTQFVGRKTSLGMFTLGHFNIPTSSIMGTIQILNFFFCIAMVFVDYKRGIYIASSIIVISLFFNIATIFISHNLVSLPGIGAMLLTLITVITATLHYRHLEESNQIDFITGLGNRQSYVRALEERIREGKPFHLASLDIKNFRHINDLYGIQNADGILKTVAQRLKTQLSKKHQIFRIGGSNFIVFISEKKQENDNLEEEKFLKKFKNIIEYIERPIFIKNAAVNNLCSPVINCGTVRFPDDGSDPITLGRNADVALSCSRKKGSHEVVIFNKEMEDELNTKIEIEKLIVEAIKNNYFYLVYQPQYEISDKKLRGFETLIRLKTPEGKVISPGIFIPIAEKSDLILKIDDYVLHRAMKEFCPVLKETDRDLTISINVSAKNIASPDFSTRVKKILAETNFPPKCLEIEITEYSLSSSIETTVQNIKELHEIGVQIALDDFGTGYTSIARLVHIPFNLLKIDKSLVDDIETSQLKCDLVDTVIYMGHMMKCEVISEGVENEKQISLLYEHKCDFVQGFVWGKPMNYDDAVNLCKI